jgi:ABC-2 type transport system ATP-binding protein
VTDVPSVVALRGLAHRLGRFELGPIDLDLPEGSITALIGPNGAGKTTLIDLAYGLGLPRAGSITMAGLHLPADLVALRERVGYVSPDLAFAGYGRVGAALDYVSGFYPGWCADECMRLLEVFALSRRDRINGLSFGARTRLSLIMALARDTDVLLLDEPTTGLDVAGRHHLFTELLRYIDQPGRAILISSHQLSELERIADRVAVMRAGQLVACGSTADLVERFQQWDVAVPGAVPPLPATVRVLGRQQGRLRLMVDLAAPDRLALGALEVVAQAPMNLEEVFLGLTGEAA